MKTKTMTHICFISVVAVSMSFCHRETEKVITEPEVPKPVLEAFKQAYPDAAVREYAAEVEEGLQLFEISFTHEGQEIDVTYTADGQLHELETTIPADQLPAAVQTELANRFTQFTINKAETISKKDEVFYEVKLSATEQGKEKKYEILFSVDGKVLKVEEGEEEEEED